MKKIQLCNDDILKIAVRITDLYVYRNGWSDGEGFGWGDGAGHGRSDGEGRG